MTLRALTTLSALAVSAASAASLPMGLVEGFYGPPWSHEDRLDVIGFLGRHGLNLYIYGPKDDPQHRAEWREPYPAEQMDEFRALVRACRDAGVDFCFAVSPGVDMTYSDPAEQRLLLDKMMCLAGDGVHHFALFLDDIDIERMGEADRARFASPAEAQMFLANALHRQILERDPSAWFVICPTLYLGVEPSPYWDTLRGQLDPRIGVIWTGIDVVAPAITDEHLDAITAHLGRPPFIWDNYPVNDFQRGQLFLGPVIGRTPALTARISGYAANPMLEAHASLIPLATIADFLRDPAGYDPERSWRRAVEEVGGAAAEDLLVFADQCRPSGLSDGESRSLRTAVDGFRASPSAGTADALSREIGRLRAAAERLPRTLDPALASEVSPWITALGARAEAMDLALQFVEGRVAPRSSGALLRFVNRVRASDVVIAAGPSERLFEMAVGLSPAWREAHASTWTADAVDPPVEGEYGGNRGPDQLIVYTPGYAAATTHTNQWGAEAQVSGGVVVRVSDEGNAAIPLDGFVVSGHGVAAAWVRANLVPETPVRLEGNSVHLSPIPGTRLTPERRLETMRVRLLDALAVLAERQAPLEILQVARLVLGELDRVERAGGRPDVTRLRQVEPRLRALETLAQASAGAVP